ncbi:ATP-dependent helicase [Patescibacteria group bacterium]|nr:ATP-dependent helicase [Patescibacteria group bacterium]
MATNLRLNREQMEAVKHNKGPLLIIAGAGTGKTTVITERIKHLIIARSVKPSEILALTFTQKAAREMEERVDIAMPYGYTDMWISTFHNFCERVLRAEALHIGLDPKFKLIGEADAIRLVRTNLFKFKFNYFLSLGNPTKFVGGILQHFSRLQDEDISPSDYAGWVKLKIKNKKSKLKEEKLELDKWEELANAYKVYEELKVKEGVMDFGDLIVKTLKLFRDRPNILGQYKERFKHILVDEYQDTNIAQNELVKLLSSKAGNITVVADDDQSIYRFRGAAVSNIIQFRKSFPKVKIVTLTKNYRSNQEILDKAYQLIQHNNPDRLEVVENIDKKLISVRGIKGQEVNFIHVDRVENEAEAVAKKIKTLTAHRQQTTAVDRRLSADSYEYRDIAILVRANNHAEPFTRALLRHNIPFQFLGPGRLFKQPEVIDLISYLRVLNNFEDSVSFYRLLSIDFFDIAARDLAAMGNYAKRKHLSLFEAAEKIEDIFVTEDTKRKVKKILEIIYKHLKLIKRETAGQLLYYFLESTGLLQKLLSPKNIDAEKKAKNISRFFDKLKTYEVDNDDATIPAVVDWIELSTEVGESPLANDSDWTDINAVNILTVHSAKGLEFPVLFLVNLVSQRFPSTGRREQIPIPDDLVKEILPVGDYHLEEERRLFYVGMTRAKDMLFLTAADYYGEGRREKKLSPFIFESLGDDVISSETSGQSSSQQLSFLDYGDEDAKTAQPPSRIAEFHVDYLSYSQIQTFEVCPLHYKLRYIFKVPTPPTAAQSIGSSAHNTLDKFYASVLAGKKPSLNLLKETLNKEWVEEGFTSKSHERQSFKKAEKILTSFYKKEFDAKHLPISLEQMFKVPIASERPLMIGGKIDRVDEVEGGIEIIDYKTGERVPSQKDADKDMQLTIYALAATSIKSVPFDRKPANIKLTLYFLETGEKVTTERTTEQLEEAKKKILEIRDKIEKSDFTCSKHMFCANCEYKLMCNS